MPRFRLTLAICLLTFSILAPTRADKASDLFQTTELHSIHLHLSDEAFREIQPRRNVPFAGLFAATRPADAQREHTSPFGYTYTYVRADIDIDGISLNSIGVRYKGNSSFMTGKGLKKPFKLDFNHYTDQEFAGLRSLNLHNNAIDPTLLRESLSYYVFRACGVPASRTTGALVYLTVEKQYDKRLLGFYTVVEEVDKRFLKDRFDSSKGLLLKPENAMNLPFMGDNWERYEKIYRPHSDSDPQLQQRLIDFLRLVHQADDATFEKRIESFIDTDNLYRFLAAHALLANMDSFLTTGHNFFLYIHPRTHKIHFIPWDLNLSLGGFDWVGGINDQVDLSYRQPWIKPNRLLDRLFAIPRHQAAYRAIVEKLSKQVFTPQRLNPIIDTHYNMLARAEKQASLPPATRPSFPDNPAFDFNAFVSQRQASISRQLTTDHRGYEPYWQRGPFGRRVRATTQATSAPTSRPSASRPSPSVEGR